MPPSFPPQVHAASYSHDKSTKSAVHRRALGSPDSQVGSGFSITVGTLHYAAGSYAVRTAMQQIKPTTHTTAERTYIHSSSQ
jgi:hypothetical protein